MGPRWVIARREAGDIVRERTILLAVLVQVVVAGFSSFLVAGLAALADPDALPAQARPEVAVDQATLPVPLRQALRAAGLEPQFHRGEDAAWAAFLEGRADAALLVRGAAGPEDPVELVLGLPDGDLRATITVVKAKEAFEAYERQLREARAERLSAAPPVFRTEVSGGSYAFVYALLIPLLVLLPVVLTGALAADALTEEVQRGTLPLLLASRASPQDVLEGKVLAHVLLAPGLAGAWLLLLGLNGLAVPWAGAAGILVLATAGATLMGLLGAAIALFTRDRNKAQGLYAAAFFLVLAVAVVLPVSPVNAIARLAAGSPAGEAWSLVAATAAAALVAVAAQRFLAPRAVARLASGDGGGGGAGGSGGGRRGGGGGPGPGAPDRNVLGAGPG